jgi:hypothetical protein
MKVILFLYFMQGTTVLNTEVVKLFESMEECNTYIEKEKFRTLTEYKNNPNEDYEIVLQCTEGKNL